MSVRSIATANGVASQRGASTDALDTTYIQAAIESARAQIGKVPGTGVMRGDHVYGGNTYAFRDDTESLHCHMFKETSTGWLEIDLGSHIRFDAGTAAFTEALVLTGGTSGATGTIARLGLQSGTWAGNDALGTLVLTGITGTFIDNETITDSSTGSATSNEANTLTLLAAGGRFEFRNGNFTGHSGTQRMYGCDGKSLAFEYDGTVFMPIHTGMTTDTPAHIHIHKNHLFLSFTGGSVQHSGIGAPYSWTLLTGATEIGIGQEITAFSDNATKTMTIFGRNNVNVLYGTSASDWELVELTDEAGAVERTAQMIGTPIYLDDQGLRTLKTTQAFGDFKLGTLSRPIDPLFKSNKLATVTPTASVRVRGKDQYLLFWSDGSAMSVYFGRKTPELMLFNIGLVIHCITSGEDSAGNEILFFGSTDGYLHQLNAGNSFDGSQVIAFIRLPFNHVGSPSLIKRWIKAILELDADASTDLGVIADFSYADPDLPGMDEQSFAIKGGGGFWNEALYNEFQWSSQIEGLAEVYIDGEGVNMSLVIRSEATYEAAHTLHGLTLHYSPRGLKR